jgi:metal-dependent amidase/aminoacylase/carboxypeptidase family protein
LIEAGAYRGVDASLMAHPSSDIEFFDGISCPKALAINLVKIKFHGKEAHAAASPWAGINALDAVVATYNNIAMLRQQLPLTERVHSIISNGGERPNIIPALAEMELYARAATDPELGTLCKRLEGCIHGGAQAAGCKVELKW